MPLYFAFGVTMDPAAMAARCPGARRVGLARLPRHRFAMAAEGFPTIVRDPQRTVHGVLWDCRLSDMPALDRAENLSTGLSVKISQPVVIAGAARRALIYVSRAGKTGSTTAGAVGAILAAARAAGLPDEYLHEIEHGEPAPRRPGTPLFRAPV